MWKPVSLWLSIGWLWLVLSGGALPAQSQKASRAPASANFTSTPAFSAGTFEEIDGEIVLRVKLNDTLNTRLVLNYRHGTSLLSSDAIQTLNLSVQTTGSGGTKVTQGRLAQLALGKATLTDVNFTPDADGFCPAWNKEHPAATISGVLGADVLEKNALGLDFVTHTYGLWLGGKITPQDAENFNRIVCTLQSDTVYSLRPGASVRVGDVTVKNPAMHHIAPQAVPIEESDGDILYHTVVQLNDAPVTVFVVPGGAGLQIAESLATRIKAMPYLSSSASYSSGNQGTSSAFYYVRTFRIGSFESLVNIANGEHRPKKDPINTVLGITSLTFPNCRVILDFPGHTLYQSSYDPIPGELAIQKFRAQLLDQGLFFPPKAQEKPSVLVIGKDSAAERAGLKSGDELLEVNGKTPAEIGELREKGEPLPAQTPLRVTVRRKDQFEKRVFDFSRDCVVNFHFTGDPPPFPDAWLTPPISAMGIYYDPIQDRAEFERGPRLLREELAKYPSALLQNSLKDIYVFKSLSKKSTVVGGFSWTQAKRLYLLDDSNPDPVAEGYLRLTMHHELAHLLLAENPSHFSRSDWQSLNPPTFQYGKGGLDTIRNGRSGVTQLEPTWWEKGFGRPYGVSDLDEDFATLCEALFSGDPRFWKAVDRVDILNKKVKMLLDFYHSLDKSMTEAYFRQITPTMKWATIPRFNYSAGDTVYFANGGKIVSTGNPPTTTEYPPGSFAIFADKDVVTWYPPGQKHPH